MARTCEKARVRPGQARPPAAPRARRSSCGRAGVPQKGYRPFAATKNFHGGGWERWTALRRVRVLLGAKSGTTFELRWRNQLSDTILDKILILRPHAQKRRVQAWKVVVIWCRSI